MAPSVLLLALAQAGAAAFSARAVDEANALAAAALEDRLIPGLSLVILQNDDTLLARGYGTTEVGGGEGVSPTTVFQLGSISKQFLAALVVDLVPEGTLSLDDSLARHLPEFERVPPGVRVRHLLSHTSGLRELFTLPEAHSAFADLTRDAKDLEIAVQRAPVDFPAGARWSYSNSNYIVLALLVEKLLGESYEQLLADRFFRPLGLTSLRHCTSLPLDEAEARGHELRDGARAPVRAAPENMSWARGDGGLCGSALDVARWTRLLATERVVPATAHAHMTTPTLVDGGRTADYGFGLSLVQPDGERKIAHNGATRGFSATAAYYPEAALTIVVLANRGDVRTESIERALARRLLDLPEPEVVERPLGGEGRRFVGTYDIGVFDVSVVERDGGLWLEMPPPGPTTPLVYVGGGELAGKLDPDALRLTFPDGQGPARELRLWMAAMHWYGRRR